ncbi:hypothetical protein G4Y79_00190 [Phototrophicus methaneseepsis]|uniref:Uncharacterized protein n=1 Tax=Phototrophicus methaneseepsis TaxID=2710758 RepID=A0A7S8IDP1_9CHLR|nr:hypothetical protein [Phototrophicus methaneseepsis]QPC82830.1 hypothetical protein G4Y79_00190 [Phototrophicus methaneseepsis]
MTTTQKRAIYGLFTLSLLLALLAAALDLVAATRYLPASHLPMDALTTLQSIAHGLREVTLFMGFLAGGVHIVIQNDPRQADMPLIRRLSLQMQKDKMLQIWALGLLIVVVSTLAMLIMPPAAQAMLQTLRLYVGYLLAGLAIAFWLMTRFSNVVYAWALRGLRSTAVMLSAAGLLLSIAPMQPLNILLIIGVPLAYMIFAAHSYRALSDPNPAKTLAAHWLALGVLLLGIGAVLATMLSLSSVQPYLTGTPWRDLQYEMMTMGLLAWVLSLLNQGVAELRAHNRRVTGFIPLWMLSASIFGGGFVLALISVVMSYGLYVFGFSAAEIQPTLVPLYLLWVGSKLVITLGLSIYSLQFYARRLQ